MANTFVDYTGDNTTTSFAFSIPYLDDSHIVVQVDQASVPGGTFVTKTLTTDYTIQTSPSNAIIFNSAPATGDRIRIKRVSDSSTALVDFENGSVLTEVELDRAYLHNLYLNEEIAEGSGNNTMVKDSVTGNFNGDLARIANVADPVDPQDVTTKNFTEATYVNTAGDTMTGVLSMGTNKITNVVDPTTNTDAATKNYVDDTIATSFATGTPPPGNTIGTSNLDDDAVTYAKLQNIAANNVLLGNDNGAGSDAQELTATEVRTILNVADGATNNRASHTGTQTASTISDFDTEVSNNSAVTANTAKVTNATHTGDVTGSTSLTIANNAVTSAKISSTDTTFNVNDSNNNIGTGALADSAFQLTVDGGSGKDTIYAKGNQSAQYVDLKLENENASGNGARFRAVEGDFTATLQVQPAYKRASMVIEDDSGSSLESVGVYVTNETGLSQGSFIPLGSMLSGTNSNINLGGTNNTWDNGYINGGAWTGSDRNLKQDIEDLSEAELRVATALKGMMKKFRLKDAVVKKGDDARIHVGVIAQDVKAAFEAEGLDAYRYALIGEDTWWSKQDENGEWLVEKTETEGFTKHTKMSVRYEQLLAFIISAL